MTEIEYRELDGWIAENVMGWKEFKTTAEWESAGKPLGRKITVLDQSPRFKYPLYTTVPAAAYEVLKKCAEKLYDQGNEQAVCTERMIDGWRVLASDEYQAPEAEANTLELAI